MGENRIFTAQILLARTQANVIFGNDSKMPFCAKHFIGFELSRTLDL